MKKAEILQELACRANPANVAGMARFGIRSRNALGVSAPLLRAMARRIGKSRPRLRARAIELAQEIRLIGSKPARWIRRGYASRTGRGRAKRISRPAKRHALTGGPRLSTMPPDATP